MKPLLSGLAALMLFQPFVLSPFAQAVEINEDGKTLIQEASQAYSADLRDRPIIMEPDVSSYAKKVVTRLIPENKQLPKGVSLSPTVIKSPKPELYSYVDGHMIMTTGLLYAMDNEAQLAGVMAHEVAQLVEGHYINMYQEIKSSERRQRSKAAAGALLGAMLDVAVDYAVEVETIRISDRLFSGEDTYRETMEKIAVVHAAEGVYTSIRDVVESIPAKDHSGQPVDPRQRFEPVADAQGMEYMAMAGYDVTEAAKGWNHMIRLNNEIAGERELAMGAFAPQMQAMQGLMEIHMQRLRQSLGASGLVQTLSDAPPSRAEFVRKLVDLKEVREAAKIRKQDKNKSSYMDFVQKTLLPRAEKALSDEEYDQARDLYQILYNKGVRTATVSYGLAKGMLGDFAFGASDAEKSKAEKRYLEAIKLDPEFVLSYRGLGELYEDWERYEDAVQSYTDYLKKASKAKDHGKIERRIKVLKRKANR